MNKSEIEICDFEMHLKNCFVSALSNDDKILRKGQVWKRVWKITFFGPKWGQDLLTERHTPPPPPHQEFPGVYPRDLLGTQAKASPVLGHTNK